MMKRSQLSFKRARMELRELGLTLLRKQGEYRVRIIGTADGEGYFTNDLWDAYQTGVRMSQEQQNNQKVCQQTSNSAASTAS